MGERTQEIKLAAQSKRFSDEELRLFYTDFKVHQLHEEDDRNNLLQCMNENREAIQDLTESTKGLLEAWDAANGAVKVGASVGKLLKWAAGIGLTYYAVLEFLKHLAVGVTK